MLVGHTIIYRLVPVLPHAAVRRWQSKRKGFREGSVVKNWAGRFLWEKPPWACVKVLAQARLRFAEGPTKQAHCPLALPATERALWDLSCLKEERVGRFWNICGLHRALARSWGSKSSLLSRSVMKRRERDAWRSRAPVCHESWYFFEVLPTLICKQLNFNMFFSNGSSGR